MDEKLRFEAYILDCTKTVPLCREFGISRKTGYKLFNGYKDERIRGLEAGRSFSAMDARRVQTHATLEYGPRRHPFYMPYRHLVN